MTHIDKTASAPEQADWWQDRRVLVTGLGTSGFAAADTLAHLGARVVVVDGAENPAIRERADILDVLGVKVLLGEHHVVELPEVAGGVPEIVITSPGWRPDNPVLVSAAQQNIPVWCDVELAWRIQGIFTDKPASWLTLTGTNGKTTTVGMVESILRSAGYRAVAAGNIGVPILDVIRDPEPFDVLAVELSSFQLHWSESLRPVASACLNIAEDHVDWHGSFENYVHDKGRVYQNTTTACIYNVQDERTRHLVEEADVLEGARAIGFTLGVPAVGMLGVFEDLSDGSRYLCDRGFIDERQTAAQEIMDAALISNGAFAQAGNPVPDHVVANALAAAALTLGYGVSIADVRQGLIDYQTGEHRIQFVAERDDITWINDSKATNPHAAAASLLSFDPIVWVAGGLAKGVTYDEIVQRVSHRLRGVVLIGKDQKPLHEALSRHAPNVPVIQTATGETKEVKGSLASHGQGDDSVGNALMEQVVRSALSLARSGDTVLMAPAAASMDQFISYADRGRRFITAVHDVLGIAAEQSGESK